MSKVELRKRRDSPASRIAHRASRIANRASRIGKVVPLLLLLGLAAAAGCRTPTAKEDASPFERLFVRMGEPQPGDWLYVYNEPERNLEEYIQSSPNRKTRERCRIYLVPMGKIAESAPDLLPAMRSFLDAFFDTGVILLKPRPIPEGAMNPRRKQNDASRLLDHLAASLPSDAAGCIGFLEYDLYHEDLNYVFGLGAFDGRRCGVYSIARYRFEYINQAGDITLLKRALKVSAHEIGHIFGLTHCRWWRCVMNGSNSITEADRRPMFLCPDCLAKLRWNLGFDPATRYDRLAAFFEKHDEFKAEAKRAKELRAALPAE